MSRDILLVDGSRVVEMLVLNFWSFCSDLPTAVYKVLRLEATRQVLYKTEPQLRPLNGISRNIFAFTGKNLEIL